MREEFLNFEKIGLSNTFRMKAIKMVCGFTYFGDCEKSFQQCLLANEKKKFNNQIMSLYSMPIAGSTFPWIENLFESFKYICW